MCWRVSVGVMHCSSSSARVGALRRHPHPPSRPSSQPGDRTSHIEAGVGATAQGVHGRCGGGPHVIPRPAPGALLVADGARGVQQHRHVDAARKRALRGREHWLGPRLAIKQRQVRVRAQLGLGAAVQLGGAVGLAPPEPVDVAGGVERQRAAVVQQLGDAAVGGHVVARRRVLAAAGAVRHVGCAVREGGGGAPHQRARRVGKQAGQPGLSSRGRRAGGAGSGAPLCRRRHPRRPDSPKHMDPGAVLHHSM